MSEILDSQLLRFHCFIDGKDHDLARTKKIECLEGHQLSYDFPYDAYWNYCCTCDRFSLSEISESNNAEDQAICRNCERTIVRRSLCNKCKMITIETKEFEGAKSFTLTSNGGPSPTCPGCLNPSDEGLRAHYCDIASFNYLTARANCPFCYKRIRPSPVHETIFPELDHLGVPDGVRLDSAASAESDSKADDGFHFLEWASKSSAVSSHLGLVVGVVGLLITLMIFVAPPLLTLGLSGWHRFWNHAPLVEPIECARSLVEGEHLTLRAHAQDPDKDRLTFVWNTLPAKIGRIEKTNEDGSEAIFYSDGVPPGIVVIGLTVSDGPESRPSKPEPISIYISAKQNHPPRLVKTPTCNCAKTEVHAGESVSLEALAEDDDKGDTLTYEWSSLIPSVKISDTKLAPGSRVILDTSGLNPQSSAEPLTMFLTISDGHSSPLLTNLTLMVLPRHVAGKSAEAAAAVLQQQTNHAPRFEKFSVSKNLVEEGESVELRALVIDPDGNVPLYYDWTTSAGAIQSNHDTAALNTTGVSASDVEVTLTVSDGIGGRTSLRTTITVRPRANKTPLSSPSPLTTREVAPSPKT